MFSLAAMIYAGASAADRAGSNPNEQSRSGLYQTTKAPALTPSVLTECRAWLDKSSLLSRMKPL
jgi:hypothetical protein